MTMTIETPRRRSDQRATSRTAPERRAEALVAAYIHELSPRHDAERERGGAAPPGHRLELRQDHPWSRCARLWNATRPSAST